MNAFWDDPTERQKPIGTPTSLSTHSIRTLRDVVRQVPEPRHRGVVDLAGGDAAPLAQESAARRRA